MTTLTYGDNARKFRLNYFLAGIYSHFLATVAAYCNETWLGIVENDNSDLLTAVTCPKVVVIGWAVSEKLSAWGCRATPTMVFRVVFRVVSGLVEALQWWISTLVCCRYWEEFIGSDYLAYYSLGWSDGGPKVGHFSIVFCFATPPGVF